MLMTLSNLIERFDLGISGVVHVGAHTGEEALSYSEAGIETVWWIEGNPDIIDTLRANVEPYGQNVVCALVYDCDGADVEFHVTNYKSLSSSIFEFGTHRQVSPDVYFVETKNLRGYTLDTIVRKNGIKGCNFLNMDLQGAELVALRGGKRLLESIDYVFTEINVDELYKGCARLPELDAYLGNHGFERVATQMAGADRPGQPNWTGWGDAFYMRGTL
jgi:FkbM family methyltransferase